MAMYQQDPSMQSSDLPPEAMIPEESMSPGGYPPSSNLPPDALQMLIGGDPSMMGQAAGGAPIPSGASQPPPGMQAGMGGGQAGMAGGMGGVMGASQNPAAPRPGMMAGNPGSDPMMAVKDQFGQIISGLQMLAEAYPMAAQELQGAGEAIARAMLTVAQGVQPDSARPPIAA